MLLRVKITFVCHDRCAVFGEKHLFLFLSEQKFFFLFLLFENHEYNKGKLFTFLEFFCCKRGASAMASIGKIVNSWYGRSPGVVEMTSGEASHVENGVATRSFEASRRCHTSNSGSSIRSAATVPLWGGAKRYLCLSATRPEMNLKWCHKT